jgi:multicomponent Na+:H+ antiporter subunit B
MISPILATATRFLLPMLMLLSLFLLLRGHNEPGGGFVGGLVASAAFALHLIARGVAETQKSLRIDPKRVIGAGLVLATLSGVAGLVAGNPFLTAVWDDTPIPVIGKIGTPFLFDLGVYLVVLGATVTIVMSLVEE